MSPDSPEVISIFADALGYASESERAAFLDRVCAGNGDLRAKVEGLLKAHGEADGFLAAPAPQETVLLAKRRAFEPGTVIAGRYKLREEIAEGGMGTVWVADQTEPVRRRVAIKLIKPGMDTRQVLSRFEAERQALALMDHPNIAKVLDGGMTDDGRPFFAMEYVKGVPITRFCDDASLPVSERLQLFTQVCQAVQHAHQKGIIHRDLKPSNILVCLYDGKPVPKVIDFGLAKAMHQPLTERTLYTAHGLMVGTPLYMSPEQAEFNNLDIDTRTDVYSLGVILYELLTGSTPLDRHRFKDAAWQEIVRLIKEQEPSKPSTKLSSSAALPSIAAQRNVEPAHLSRLVRGDLDWIVMKALEKERSRRYETANGLARDIARFLTDQPVEACPPSAGYRLRKFARRNKAAFTTVAVIATTLLLASGVSTWQAVRATRAERLADQRLQEVQVEQGNTQQALVAAQKERDRALESENRAMAARNAEETAKQAETEQRLLAEKARMAEAEQRAEAERQRDDAQRLRDEAVGLNAQLQRSAEEQRRAIYASEMNLVRLEAQRGNLQRMREILMQQLPITGDEDLRGFEWNYWYRYLTQAQVLRQFENFRYGKPDSALAIAPGGQIAGHTHGMSTDILHIASGKLLGSIPKTLRIAVNRTRFSSSGRSVHGACVSQTAFQPSTGGLTKDTGCTVYEPTGVPRTFTYPPDSLSHVSYLTISDDGRRVAALGNDVTHRPEQPACRLLVWDIDSGQLQLDQVLHREINRLQFSPNGARLAVYVCHSTQRDTDEVRDVAAVVDVDTGAVQGVARHNDDIDAAFWIPGQERLLLCTLGFSGANRKELLAWTIGDQTPRRLTGETMPDYVKGDVSPDGRLFAVSGHTVSSIRLFDTERGNVVDTLHNEARTIDTLSFTSNAEGLVASSTTGEVLQWNLSSSRDLFKLRSNPLKQLAYDGYALSADQTLLAVAHADGAIRVRARDGDEVTLRDGFPNAPRGQAKMTISPDNRLLACKSDVDAQGVRQSSKVLVEMYDLPSRRRLWSRVDNTRNIAGALSSPMLFTPDSRVLQVSSWTSAQEPTIVLVDARTGKPGDVAFNNGLGVLTQEFGSGRLLLYDVTMINQHPLLRARELPEGKVLAAMAGPAGLNFGLAGGSPDGRHVAFHFSENNLIAVWNLAEERLVFEAPGMQIVFSPDGRHAAVGVFDLSIQDRATNRAIWEINNITLWDTARGEQLSTVSLAGNPAHGMRFSPDGRRLLTLHGKIASGSGGDVPQGCLWDVQSGREIMSIPVADVNHYIWDLVFDPTGQRLTSFVLTKSAGTGGGWGTTVYDATPLGTREDTQLIARRLVDELSHVNAYYPRYSRGTPFPPDVVESLLANTRISPAVRDAAIELARQLPANVDVLIGHCLDILDRRDATPEQQKRVMRWAKSIRDLEPSTLRSRVVLGAAQCRAGQTAEAVNTLQAPSTAELASNFDRSDFQLLRELFLALALSRSGQAAEARTLALRFTQPDSGTFGLPPITIGSSTRFSPSSTFSEVWALTRSRSFRPTSAVPTAEVFEPETIETVFVGVDRNGDGKFVEAEARSESHWRNVASFDADRDNALDKLEFARGFQVLVRMRSQEECLRRGMIKEAFEQLDRALEVAPDHLPALNARAWLRSTTSDGQFRNGEQALTDATRVCERTEWKNPGYLNTLAAACAEQRRFKDAVKWQQQALNLVDEAKKNEFQARLKLYQRGEPFREAPVSSAATTFIEPPALRPLLSAEDVDKARRIPGSGASWSRDGRRIVRNLVYDQSRDEGDLAIVDLETGQTTAFCKGGIDPAWSPLPGGPIAFVRGPEGAKRESGNESVWLIEEDGSNPRKVTDGGFPSWSNDGRLFYRKSTADVRHVLQAIRPEAPNDLLVSLPCAAYAAASFDGRFFANPFRGVLTIDDLTAPKTIRSLEVGASFDDYGAAGWSPDGRILGWGSFNTDRRGLWLFDVKTGERRLLVSDVSFTLPRWSPDGRFIAVDDRLKNEIVLLDVSSLHLSDGLPARPLP